MAVHDLAMLAAAIGIGYLFGSIPFAILVERWKKLDVRRFGSGNLGAANAFVVGGKLAGQARLLTGHRQYPRNVGERLATFRRKNRGSDRRGQPCRQ